MNPHLHNPHLDGSPFFWEGGATGVLLMHGLTATPAEVRLLGERLHQAGYTVSAPLLPGHGTSPAELNRVCWQDWWETAVGHYHYLATVCDHVFVGGESTGAVLALHLATYYPEIAGVLAYSPAIRLQLSRIDQIKLRLGAYVIASLPKESIDVSEKWQGYPENPLRAGVELLRLQKATFQRLPKITQPLLVVQGDHDTTIHPHSGQMIVDAVSATDTNLHRMANSSHVVLLDREFEAIVGLTLAFMSRVLA